MKLCNDCTHVGLCLMKQKLLEDTVLEFPDGKMVIVDMESAVVSCDHFASAGDNLASPAQDLDHETEYSNDDVAVEDLPGFLDDNFADTGFGEPEVEELVHLAPGVEEIEHSPDVETLVFDGPGQAPRRVAGPNAPGASGGAASSIGTRTKRIKLNTSGFNQ